MNRLANETSPYLLQHANNPVDWYPWGEEAFTEAQSKDKPILLSIGYSACHWCHVMERESFEDEHIASLMNTLFVSIKVDREERPDLDNIYMQAVQAMTGSGGWPLTVFLTPDKVPFYGGTYFPPEPRHGMPAFPQVLQAVADAYANRKAEIEQNAQQLMRHLEQEMGGRADVALTREIWQQAVASLHRQFDRTNGGFGGAPKFPQAMALNVLLRDYGRTENPSSRQVLETSLVKMARGGVYDQVGGGFHRYAVDEMWLVPHFEKMLYDNALLSRLYLEAYQALGTELFRQVAEEILDYVQRDMTSPKGGFYATEDADSEGEEGKFYLWTAEEITDLLGPDKGRIVNHYYGLHEGPNFEGKNILQVSRPPEEIADTLGISQQELDATIRQAKQDLLKAREERTRPGRDEKILTAWNGLMLQSVARAAAILDRKDYRAMAVKNATFLHTQMWDGERLYRVHTNGQTKLNGYLKDYAATAHGFLDLWETTFDVQWFEAAHDLLKAILAHFYDPEREAFFDTSDEHESLIVRPRDVQDNAAPSGHSLTVLLLLRFAAFTGESDYARRAQETLKPMAAVLAQHPLAFGQWLSALDRYLGPEREIAIVGNPSAEDTKALLRIVHDHYHPNVALACGTPESQGARAVPLLAERDQLAGQATAYVCQNFTCQQPVVTTDALAEQLRPRNR